MTAARSLLVTIPVYNDAARIGRAVQSVLDQTVAPSRIEIVDDGSSEDIPAALAPFGDRVAYHRQANAGPVAARNGAIARGREEIIASVDADDRMAPHWLESALRILDADPDVGGTVCMAQNMRADGTPVGDPLPAYTLGATVIRRRSYDRIGLPDPALQHGAALDWFLRARDAAVPIVLDRQPHLLRLLHAGSMSSVGREASWQEHLRVVRASLRKRQGEPRGDQ